MPCLYSASKAIITAVGPVPELKYNAIYIYKTKKNAFRALDIYKILLSVNITHK